MTFIRLLAGGAAVAGVAFFWTSEPVESDGELQTPSLETVAEVNVDSDIVPDEHTATEWEPPFPEKEHLFSAPSLDAPKLPAPEIDESGRIAVRVIGFVNVVGDQSAAILDVGGVPVMASVGESVSGVKVVGLNDPDVTLQRNGDRWSVNLFHQAPGTSTGIAQSSEHSSQRDRAGRHPDGPVSRISPDTTADLNTVPDIPDPTVDLPTLELPELDDLPDLPAELRSSAS